MVHEDYKEMIPARALSALDAAEAHALNEHLENCAECRKDLDEWQATASALALGASAAEPSPQVRERILDEVRKDLEAQVVPFRSSPRNLWSSFGSLGAMAAAVLFTALIVGLVVLWRQNNAIRTDLEQSREFVQLVTSPGARVRELKGVDVAAGATATVAPAATSTPFNSRTLAPGEVTSCTNSLDCCSSSLIALFCRHITTRPTIKAVNSTAAAIAPNEPNELQRLRDVDLNGTTFVSERSFRTSSRIRSRTFGEGSAGFASNASAAAVACQSSSSFRHSAQFSRCSFNVCASAASSADNARAGIISL